MSPHAHLARSPVGLADKVWLEAVGREPGENSPWYRSHVLAQRPKLASETSIPQEWLNLALSDATAAAETLRAGAPIGKLRLGCDVGEGVGRSQSVIVVRDDLGVLEIFANQFESKAETAHKICGLAQKWRIGDWMGPPTLRYQGLDGATHFPAPRKCGWPLSSPFVLPNLAAFDPRPDRATAPLRGPPSQSSPQRCLPGRL